ncbi:MAG: class I SAM-dependent methyltransferase [Chlamydiales bacterium]|nr:class I SAM-dependent methyltransferase [Chlamydiales bacterium]
MSSIQYYNTHSKAFYQRTVDANLSAVYEKFVQALGFSGHILDAGCGIGRDSRFFRSQGYTTVAFDGSEEMVRLATESLGENVFQMLFQDMAFSKEFDGIWACASLLHVPYDELRSVMKKIHASIKPGGIFYASFKYGDTHRAVDERDFYDQNEETIAPYLEGLFAPISIWESADTRVQAASPRQSWLNILCRAI